MKENTQEKSLIQINENNIFYKLKTFFRNLLHKNINNDVEKNISSNIKNEESAFIENIKNIEDDETKLLKLQKQYRSGEIKEEELTKEQIHSLCDLYDKQIENLRKSNENRKQKLLEYRRKLQTNN